jgi:hypothetical protein
MNIFNLFRKKKVKTVLDKKQKQKGFKRFGFGKKIWVGKLPLRYIHSQKDVDLFLREDTNTLISFSSEYIDKIVTLEIIKK